MRHPYTPLAKTLRAKPTPAEARLWGYLRQRPFGFKFRRQVPIDRYIVDFASFGARLIVEVDGRFHAEQEADLTRDARLVELGWKVLRYWNDEVIARTEDVLADLLNQLQERGSPTPGLRPPPPRRAVDQGSSGP